MGNAWTRIAAPLTVVLLTGCMSSTIQPVKSQYWTRRAAENALTSNRISAQATTYLALRGWDEKALRHPQDVLTELRKNLIAVPDREGLTAFAEVAYYAGIETKPSAERKQYLLSATRAAYAVLFDPEMGPMLDPLDPNMRFAADLYNYSLSELATLLLQSDFYFQEKISLQLIEGDIHIERGHGLGNALSFNKILVAFSYKTPALRHHNRRRGLGVPLVTLRQKETLLKNKGQHHPPVKETDVSPTTLLLRFQQPWRTTTEPFLATAEIWNPLSTSHVEIANQQIPLEADTSLSLAMLYDQHADYRGLLNMPRFLRGDFMGHQRGLYLMEPYDKKKVPIVFIHGLMDSPLTWFPMINELLSDPVLKENTQFWFFFYPTMNPILQSASELRESLQSLQKKMEQENREWDNMVLVGHSMGGLLARLVITPSEDHFDGIKEHALRMAQGDPELQDYFKEVTTFEPLPFIQRVLFMGTPHGGANMAGKITGRTGSALMTRPDYMRTFLEAKEGRAEQLGRVKNGIDDLNPTSAFTRSLQASHWTTNTPVHSIIGDYRKAGKPNGTDTVVPYSSAHIDGEESEIIVHADHLTLHKKIPAIAEVRRILIKHIGLMPDPISSGTTETRFIP